MGVKEEEEEEEESGRRQRFYIELKPGETALVSWKKLLKDASHFHHSSSLLNSLDDDSSVGRLKNSSIKDERLGNKTKARLLDNKKPIIPAIKSPMTCTRNDFPTRKLEDCKTVCTPAVAKAPSTTPKYISCYDKTSVIRDQQLERLHDVPVMYSKISPAFYGRLKRPSPVNVPEVTSVIPLKTKHDIPHQIQKVPDIISPGFARSFAPLQTYRRSKNLVDGIRGKVQSTAQNDVVVASCQKRKVTNSNDRPIYNKSPYLEGTRKKVAVECPSSLSKSSHYAKNIECKPSREANLGHVPHKPHLKELKMDIPEKKRLKVRFHLKSDHEPRKTETTQLQ